MVRGFLLKVLLSMDRDQLKLHPKFKWPPLQQSLKLHREASRLRSSSKQKVSFCKATEGPLGICAIWFFGCVVRSLDNQEI
jgi:hypothetical protein